MLQAPPRGSLRGVMDVRSHQRYRRRTSLPAKLVPTKSSAMPPSNQDTKRVSFILVPQRISYHRPESFDEWLFRVGRLESPHASVEKAVANFLSRAAHFAGHEAAAYARPERDVSPLSKADFACWRTLASHAWEDEAEFFRDDDVRATRKLHNLLQAVMPTKIKDRKRAEYRRQCLQHLVNSCLAFGDAPFTLNDLACLLDR
ncbi:hypothetical protein SDRG_17144 [Saprolegnia diclina VS20]|uniref:Uncharacterized protein n=1 Tax=Saprolegnia diclina (strain VS20) TaxID=1156394 RepID=T0QZ14_SAPDV|nr:hypothetical protein SDRG_17144 [Saprolegnia diclina VS20]EQC24968.1 hypothetical protein SDRG_17144 [Saprolegnia diclina VS20]|eukprot:XP_008621601.1 hypothetical protein SDRG_17144 [Saprolegnia diclina VS20]